MLRHTGMSETPASILIVDDHPDNIRTLAAILSSEGYKVRKAISGEVALETIRSQPPDIILLDIKMPNMDGYTVCQIIKSVPETRDIPVIFLSALDETADKVKAFAVGGADYITKPFHAEEVLVRIGHQLTIRQQQWQLSILYQQVQQLNAVLQNQVRERTTQLQEALEFESLLKRITDKVRDSLDEGQIVQAAVEELAVRLRVERCNTGIYDAHLKTSTIAHESKTSASSTIGCKIQIKTLGIYGQLLQKQAIQFCWYPQVETGNGEGNQEDGRGERESVLNTSPSLLAPKLYEEYAILACPIFDNQGVLGDLWLFKAKEEVFDELEVRLVLQVANQCAIAIRQARLYQSAQAQVTELEKLNRLKDDFLSTVSHELRTPVANIKLAIHMLAIALSDELNVSQELAKPERQRRKVSQYFKILQDECDRELKLLQDLLDLQHLDADTYSLEPTTIDLHDWIPHTVEAFEICTQNQQQILQVQLAPHLPPLSVDLPSFTRILTELVNNACKYTPLGETIIVAARAEAKLLHLSVSNSGVEIPTEELPRIFNKFYRIPNSDPWKHGGTGLGLALVKGLVERLGGAIEVNSANNLTCFTVKLPITAETSA